MIFGHQTDDHSKVTDDQLPSGSPMSNSFIVGAQPVDQTTSIPSAPTADSIDNDVTPSVLEQAHPTHAITDDDSFEAVGLSDESAPSAKSMPAPSEPAKTEASAPEPEEAETEEKAEVEHDEHEAENKDEHEDTDKKDGTSEVADITSTPHADLLVLKQQALNDLGPLVNQLEQTAEERFRTTMMMIQSTDNQDLIKEAYAAAQEIENEKVRAQALLDVVNEINYFTQKSEQQ